MCVFSVICTQKQVTGGEQKQRRRHTECAFKREDCLEKKGTLKLGHDFCTNYPLIVCSNNSNHHTSERWRWKRCGQGDTVTQVTARKALHILTLTHTCLQTITLEYVHKYPHSSTTRMSSLYLIIAWVQGVIWCFALHKLDNPAHSARKHTSSGRTWFKKARGFLFNPLSQSSVRSVVAVAKGVSCCCSPCVSPPQ